MAHRPNILALASKISLESLTYTGITYGDPEYRILDPIVDDDMCSVMMRMRLETDFSAEDLAKKTRKSLDFVQTLAAGLQRFIIHIFLRINHAVQYGGLQDSKQVADNPVQRHAQRHEPAQIQAQSDGERHGAIFVQQSLLALQHVLAVLVQAQKP